MVVKDPLLVALLVGRAFLLLILFGFGCLICNLLFARRVIDFHEVITKSILVAWCGGLRRAVGIRAEFLAPANVQVLELAVDGVSMGAGPSV